MFVSISDRQGTTEDAAAIERDPLDDAFEQQYEQQEAAAASETAPADIRPEFIVDSSDTPQTQVVPGDYGAYKFVLKKPDQPQEKDEIDMASGQ